jgi:hypothetical protein
MNMRFCLKILGSFQCLNTDLHWTVGGNEG